jgi:hypothetical protein
MRKIPTWLLITFACFLVGIISVVIWKVSFSKNEVESLPEICWSKTFPGKAVSFNKLTPQTRSPFDNKEFFKEQNDKFYAAFQEERFETEKLQNGKLYPEIAQASEIYRFFWLRTFHSPIIIRIYSKDNEKYIISKQTDGRGGYYAGNLVFNKTRKLEDSEWCEFLRLLDEADFWNKKEIEVAKLANDGSFWHLEGVSGQRYFIAGEQSPQESKFRDACIYLMRISGLNIDENSEEFY